MARVPLSMPCCERKFYRGRFYHFYLSLSKVHEQIFIPVALGIQQIASVRWRELMDKTLI